MFFAEQYRAIDFVEVTDSARVQMLSNLFGFSRLEKIRSELQKKASELQVDRVGDDVVSSLKAALESAEQRRDQLLTQQSELSKILLSPEGIAANEEIIASPELGYYDRLEGSITETQCEVDLATTERAGLPEPVSADDAVKYSQKLRFDGLSKTLSDLKAKLAGLQDAKGLAPNAIREFQASIRQSMSQQTYRKDELARRAQLLQSGKCPLTRGVPCPDLVALTDQQQISDEIESADRQLSQMQADYDELAKELIKSEEHERHIQSCQIELASVSAELDAVSVAADFDAAAYEQRVAADKDTSVKRSELDQKIAVGNSKLSQLKQELESSRSKHPVEYSVEDKSAANKALASHRSALDNLQLLSTLVPDSEKAVADSRSSLSFAAEQNSLADKNTPIKGILDKVRSAFHRDNLPRLLVEDMLEVLNSVLERYLSKFNFPYKVVWASGGSLLYSDDLGQWHKASQLSGGQKYVLVIALRCALIDMLQSEFPLFVLDEPTTGLDVENREALGSVLSAVVSSNKDRILVVPTHDELLLPTANIINVGCKNV